MKLKKLSILALALAMLVSCAGQGNTDSESSEEAEVKTEPMEETSEQEESKSVEEEESEEESELGLEEEMDQAYVKGAVTGSSRSDFVVDREIWKDEFSEEGQKAAANLDLGIHIPKFLFDSEDAKEANEELDQIASEIVDAYHSNDAFDLDDKFASWLPFTASFSVYQNKDLLSVHFEYNHTDGVGFKEVRNYNFSLEDGSRISDKDMLAYLDLDESRALAIKEDTIREELSSYYDHEKTGYENITYPSPSENYEGLSLKKLWEGTEGDIYLDELGKASFNYTALVSPAGDHYVTQTKLNYRSVDDSPYLDEYIKMAKETGLDVEDEKYQGIMIYLGEVFDEESAIAMLKKLNRWQSLYYGYADPRLLINISRNEESFEIINQAREYYLLVPKYRNAVVSLTELALTENGELGPVENYTLESMAAVGPVLIGTNMSETSPNAEVKIQYRDKDLSFTPSISGEDGEVILPEEIYNGKDIVDFDQARPDAVYSWYLYEKIMSILNQG